MVSYVPPAEWARRLLSDLKINQPPVPVEYICNKLNVEYIYGADIETEALIIKGDSRERPLIAVKTNEKYSSRVRFNVAHELGHLCIPSHLNETYYCTIEDLNNYQENKPAEKEANEFAAELLMPRSWLTQAIKAQDVSMQLLKSIANECETSLTSTAIQVAELCPDRIAVIFAQNGQIVWYKKAKSFDLFLAPGNIKGPSLALRLHQEPSSYMESAGLVPLHAWTYDDRPYSELYEESLYMTSLDSTLTVLRIPCDEFEEDADDWHD